MWIAGLVWNKQVLFQSCAAAVMMAQKRQEASQLELNQTHVEEQTHVKKHLFHDVHTFIGAQERCEREENNINHCVTLEK